MSIGPLGLVKSDCVGAVELTITGEPSMQASVIHVDENRHAFWRFADLRHL